MRCGATDVNLTLSGACKLLPSMRSHLAVQFFFYASYMFHDSRVNRNLPGEEARGARIAGDDDNNNRVEERW